SRMYVIDVIAAVEIVIYEYLPITRQFILAAFNEAEFVQLQRRGLFRQAREKLGERHLHRFRMDKDEGAPGGDAKRHQAVVFATEFGNSLELRRPAQSALQIVRPAMIGAAQPGRATLRLGHHSRRAMPAYVVKRPQFSIAISQNQDRLTGIF